MNYQHLIATELKKYCVQDNNLNKSIRYSLISGGKCFRGTLCLMVANIFENNDTLSLTSSCAVEMIHTYSLIHDDLPAMDNDDMRRGKLTNHKKFDEATAILAGDGLQSLAFNTIANDNLLTNTQKISLIQILSNASFDMVLGQKLDFDSNEKITLLELKKINKLKTGALLKASILMGGIIAKVDDKIMQTLTKFADNLGEAYQVQDDSFDGKNVENIGKTNNTNKTTFVTLLGLKEATNYYHKLYDNAIKELQNIKNTKELQSLVLLIKNRKF